MKVLRTRDEILRALSLLREESSDDSADEERKKQNKMKREIKKVKEISEEEDEEGEDKGGDEKGGEEKSEEKPEDKPAASPEKKDAPKKALPGSDDLKKSPIELPDKIDGSSVVDRVNKIRAGSSLKDPKVQKKIDSYVMSLSSDQQKAMYTYLDALARIILAGMDPAEVPVPGTMKGAKVTDKEEKKTAAPEVPKSDLPIVAPVVVGEGVRKKLKEIDVPVRSGRVVPFGSKSHITDLEDRINDMVRIRSYQEPGSDTRHTFTMAINALKSQLKAAIRANGSGNPRTQPVPPMVERE